LAVKATLNEQGRVRTGKIGALSSSLTIQSDTFYTSGSYSAYASTYAAASTALVKGTDFDAVWTLGGSFPNSSVLNWYTPKGTIPNSMGVWGFHHIDYANYDNSVQQVQITPQMVGDISTFIASFDHSYTGTAFFNTLHEIWLDKDGSQTASRSSGALFEIGFLLHPGDSGTFHASGTLIGTTHVNNSVTYTARSHGTYITFMASADVLSGTIDWAAALNFLITNEVITGSEWVSGISFGVEPVLEAGTGTRTGQFTLNTFSASLTGTGAASADYLGTNIFPNGNAPASWSASDVTFTAGQTDRDGGTAAVFVAEAATTNVHGIFQTSLALPTAQHDYMYFTDVLNNKGRDFINVEVASADFANQLFSIFGLAAFSSNTSNTLGTAITLIDREIIDLGSGWRRVIIRFRKAAGITSTFFLIGPSTGTTNASANYLGDVTKGLTLRPRMRLIQVA
jgi:hypothetical protein